MDYNNQPRPEHKAGDADGCAGGWKCSQCNAAIETLPFKPDPARMGQITCRGCYKARRQASAGK